jgi:hypothetical protein
LGWYVERDGRNRTIIHHTGHLPGSGAFMGRRSDGVGAAVLFNCDTTPRNELLIPLFPGRASRCSGHHFCLAGSGFVPEVLSLKVVLKPLLAISQDVA